MDTLLSLINDYDVKAQKRIEELEQKVAILEKEKSELLDQLILYTETVAAMKLQLIMSGRLK